MGEKGGRKEAIWNMLVIPALEEAKGNRSLRVGGQQGLYGKSFSLKKENSQPTGDSKCKTLPLCSLKLQISPLPRMNYQTVVTSIKSESS